LLLLYANFNISFWQKKKLRNNILRFFLMARYQSIDISFLTPQNGRAKSQKSLK